MDERKAKRMKAAEILKMADEFSAKAEEAINKIFESELKCTKCGKIIDKRKSFIIGSSNEKDFHYHSECFPSEKK